MSKEYDIIEVDKYNALQLQEYNGKYGILSLEKGGGMNETWFKKWVFLSQYRNGKSTPTERKLPMAVRLGEGKDGAITALKAILEQLERPPV